MSGAAIAPSLSLSGDVAFDGAVLLRGLELDVAAGGWTCILGPSGVGKSTLLRLIAGLETGGTFRGRVAAGDSRPVAPRVAYMAQSDLLAPWLDVRANATIGARLRGETPDRARADAIIRAVGLEAHAAKFPRQLSGGMRQRAALARTLMEARPIALLDEPFSALDARTRADMQELSFAMLDGCTVLLVTHDPAEAARLGSVIYLLTETGLEKLVPGGPAPLRAPNAAATLAIQTDLFDRLRARPA